MSIHSRRRSELATERRLALAGLIATFALAALLLLVISASAAVPNFCPPGEGAGQCDFPHGVAVDQATGTIYLADNNSRIDVFDPSGKFLRAFGWGVRTGAEEVQTCTTVCQAGAQGSKPGQIRPLSVAVDPAGNVYASDLNQQRVEKFDPEGHLLLLFGKDVDKGPHHPGDVCTAAFIAEGDACGAGTPGSGPGEFSTDHSFAGGLPLAVGPAGNLWVGDIDRLESFGPAGTFLSEVKLPGAGTIWSLAVDSAGEFYVRSGTLVGNEIENDVPGVRKYAGSGALIETIDAAGHPNALALDPASGNLFVSDQPEAELHPGTASLLEYDPAGTQIESFATGTVSGQPQGNSLVFGGAVQRLYTANNVSSPGSAAQSFSLPEPGPLPEAGSEVASPIKKTSATLKANVNPEGASTTVHFQYVDQSSYETEGGFASPNTQITVESAPVGSDFSQHPASVEASGLSPETTYRFRLVATNENGVVVGEGGAFTTLPPLRIDATFTTEVSATGATLGAQVNPLGDPASYHFEYLSEAAFLGNGEAFAGPNPPTSVPVPDGQIAASESDVTVSRRITRLLPSTAYRYRIVLANSVRPAGIFGPVQQFTTEGPGTPLALPDNRAWEMVSPVEKGGGGVSGINQGAFLSLVEASADGEAITYGSPVAFAGPAGSPPGNQYLSNRRGRSGWSTANVGIPTNGEAYEPLGDPPYKAFSADLSSGLVSSGNGYDQRIAPENPPLPGTEAAAGRGNFYLRANGTGTYRAILTAAVAESESVSLPLRYEGATPDLQHVVVSEPDKSSTYPASHGNLYEWGNGHLDLLNLLPGKTVPTNTSTGLGNGERQNGIQDLRALSSDGTRAVWAATTSGSQFKPAHNLYLRENIGQPQSVLNGKKECIEPEAACTLQIDAAEGGPGKGGNGAFLAASADDSAIFFADHQRLTADSTADQLPGEPRALGDLYRFEPDREPGQRLADLTIDHADPGGAEVLGLLGASDDGSYLYFVANGVLAGNAGADGTNAKHGNCDAKNVLHGVSCNLYLLHGGETIFIATLAGEDNDLQSDVVSLGAGEGNPTGAWSGVAYRDARVSPDGRHLLLVSYRSLTGYDNVAANGSHCGTGQLGEPLSPTCPQVYRYAAETEGSPSGRLACLSCNPAGQRPIGLSGIPGGTHTAGQEWDGIYQSRPLAADGSRAFFDSYDALVPQDTNGKMDVYEWEETGAGSCSESSSTFSKASSGCVGLISSGTDSEGSFFMDASANGSDVFFITGSSLVKSDPGSVDLYDARIDGGLPEPPPPPASCQGDSCQSPPPVPNDPTPASVTFNDPGNEVPSKSCLKGKIKRDGKCAPKHRKKKTSHKRTGANRRAGT